MGARDAGWIQMYAENPQEAYDLWLIGIKAAENHDVLLPAMIMYDGFIISHTMEVVETLPDDAVKDYVGPYKPAYAMLLDEKPFTVGPLDFHDYYFEHKRPQHSPPPRPSTKSSPAVTTARSKLTAPTTRTS
jgi:pyruvate ferredoxin oxidoreductase alpha subunit